MTRPVTDVLRVAALLEQGLSEAQAARQSGVPRSTLRYWVRQGMVTTVERHRSAGEPPGQRCEACPHLEDLSEPAYAYLLGLYLGDGCISSHPRGVYRLRIVLDLRYPNIIHECRGAMASVLPNRVGEVMCPGCVEVGSYSKHWTCLFPQHGPGPKHKRPIVLEPWQERIGIRSFPHLLLRGLIHSDGWRGTNRVGGHYEYVRYMFSNRSKDIRGIFRTACEQVGIECRQSNAWALAVSTHADVEKMDLFVGAKS